MAGNTRRTVWLRAVDPGKGQVFGVNFMGSCIERENSYADRLAKDSFGKCPGGDHEVWDGPGAHDRADGTSG